MYRAHTRLASCIFKSFVKRGVIERALINVLCLIHYHKANMVYNELARYRGNAGIDLTEYALQEQIYDLGKEEPKYRS